MTWGWDGKMRRRLKRERIYVYIQQSVQFSRSVVSDSLRPHESQHTRPPCPSPTPRVYSDSRPSSWWCHLALSSSVVPFSSCPQSLPASESFPKSQLFAWGDQSITSWQIDEETMETVRNFIYFCSKITADGDFSHEIKRRLLLGRKVMTNLDSI